MVDGLGRDAGAERGRQIAFGQRWVVAVPVQLHALARLLVEDGGKVAGAIALAGRDRAERHLHLDELVRVEGVDAAGPPRRLFRQERLEPRAPLDEPFAHPRYDVVPPHLPLDEPKLGARRLHGRDQRVGGEALVGTGLEHEADEAIEVQIVRRHAGDSDARAVLGRPVGAGVADGAIEPDQIDTLVIALGNADRQIDT